jgi:hypothetical protein
MCRSKPSWWRRRCSKTQSTLRSEPVDSLNRHQNLWFYQYTKAGVDYTCAAIWWIIVSDFCWDSRLGCVTAS